MDKIFNGLFDKRRIIESPNITNIRDLGGIPCGKNRIVKSGIFYRSGALSRLEDDDIKVIENLGIKRVVDLRSYGEIEREPNIKLDTIEYYHYPGIVGLEHDSGDTEPDDMDMKGAISTMIKHPETRIDPKEYLTKCYIAMAKTGNAFRSTFELIKQDPQSPLLFHCSAGKDRTGVLGALILLLLGASEENVLKDYMLSNEYRKKENKGIMNWVKSQTQDREFLEGVHYMLVVEEDLIRAFFDTALKIYGDWDAYFNKALGISQSQREDIIKATTSIIE